MTKIFDLASVSDVLRKARDEFHKRHKFGARPLGSANFVDVITVQACAVLDLLDECAEPNGARVAGISSEEIRLAAYKVAIAEIQTRAFMHGDIHPLARAIADNIENGFDAPEEQSDTVAPSWMAERTEWRREAWNDCKDVMIREVHKQLIHRTSEDVLFNFSDAEIRTIRRFIDSFQFDKSKP